MSEAGFVVTEMTTVTLGRGHVYPLLPGDLLVHCLDGTFSKVAPGLGINGIALTPGESDSLRPVRFEMHPGLTFSILEGDSDA